MAETPTTETPPPMNTTEARTTDGTIKDQASTTTPSTEIAAKTEPSLLNQGDKTVEPKVEAKTEDKKPGDKTAAPEKYEPFKAPEGYEYDPKSLEEVGPIFKDLGLTQDQAQKLMDVYAKKSLEAAQAPYDAYKAMREGWQAEVKADKEIGGILPKVKETIGRALDSLGDANLTAEFKKAMDMTGAGDNPAFVKAFYKLSQVVVEGKHVAGGGPSPHGQSPNGKATRPSLAEAMYGSSGPRADLPTRS